MGAGLVAAGSPLGTDANGTAAAARAADASRTAGGATAAAAGSPAAAAARPACAASLWATLGLGAGDLMDEDGDPGGGLSGPGAAAGGAVAGGLRSMAGCAAVGDPAAERDAGGGGAAAAAVTPGAAGEAGAAVKQEGVKLEAGLALPHPDEVVRFW
jgi:hypothetical protein